MSGFLLFYYILLIFSANFSFVFLSLLSHRSFRIKLEVRIWFPSYYLSCFLFLLLISVLICFSSSFNFICFAFFLVLLTPIAWLSTLTLVITCHIFFTYTSFTVSSPSSMSPHPLPPHAFPYRLMFFLGYFIKSLSLQLKWQLRPFPIVLVFITLLLLSSTMSPLLFIFS